MADRSDNNPTTRNAAWLAAEIASFETSYPPLDSQGNLPPVTWEALERQLATLVSGPVKPGMVGPLVSAIRKQARFKPPEMVLREILQTAGTLMDESFQPGLQPGEEGEMI